MTGVGEYDDPAKDVAWAAWWESFKTTRGSESFDPIHRKTAKSLFERWWGVNGGR